MQWLEYTEVSVSFGHPGEKQVSFPFVRSSVHVGDLLTKVWSGSIMADPGVLAVPRKIWETKIPK